MEKRGSACPTTGSRNLYIPWAILDFFPPFFVYFFKSGWTEKKHKNFVNVIMSLTVVVQHEKS